MSVASGSVRFGRVPHPTIVEVDTTWLLDALQPESAESPDPELGYVRLTSSGKELGVMQVVDSRIRSQELLYVHPRAWLSSVPPPGSDVEIAEANEIDFRRWRQRYARWPHIRWLAALVMTVAAGLIEMFWSVGKYWPVFEPGDGLAGLSQLLKWVLLGLGLAGLTAYKDFRGIEL